MTIFGRDFGIKADDSNPLIDTDNGRYTKDYPPSPFTDPVL
jgi:hypothetical protein